jgi:hypothetical protein
MTHGRVRGAATIVYRVKGVVVDGEQRGSGPTSVCSSRHVIVSSLLLPTTSLGSGALSNNDRCDLYNNDKYDGLE